MRVAVVTNRTDSVGNYLALGVGNYVTPPLGNCLTLEALRLGNYLALDSGRAWSLEERRTKKAND